MEYNLLANKGGDIKIWMRNSTETQRNIQKFCQFLSTNDKHKAQDQIESWTYLYLEKIVIAKMKYINND